MTIRRRLALSFGATLLLFCLNLLAHFVTSQQRDVSLHHFRTAVQRRLLWASLEHEYRNRWQELSVLSELPFTPEQAKEVQDRIAGLTARIGPMRTGDDAAAAEALARFLEAQRAFEQRAREWLDRRVNQSDGQAEHADGFQAVSTALSHALEQLDALNAGDERLVNDEMAQLARLTQFMNQVSLFTFILSIFVAAVIALSFSRYLTGGLRTLQTGAERVGRGDLTSRILPRSDDELGSLARSFNEMTEKLAATMRELVDARAQADRASQAKSTFLANMSHEFRTPMLAVQGYAELIEQQATALNLEEIADDSRQIHMAGQHLVTLLNEVLDLSKIESGKMTLVIEELNLRRMVDEVAATMRPLVAQRSNTLSITFDDELDTLPLQGDEIKLRQILLNLLGNASKFTSNGTIALRVRATASVATCVPGAAADAASISPVRVAAGVNAAACTHAVADSTAAAGANAGNGANLGAIAPAGAIAAAVGDADSVRRTYSRREWVIFEVADSGIGMTLEQTQRIFEEFEQAEPTTARAFGGSGLGLAICQKMALLMGGDISVSSELGVGTTFTVTLPMQPAGAASAEAAPSPAASPSRDAALRPSGRALPAAS